MLSINAKIREQLGRSAKKIRKDEQIPAVIYGRKAASTPISIGYKEFERVYKNAGENTLISLNIEGGNKDLPGENTVLIRDAVAHPLTKTFIHVDFYQVPMDEKIAVSIPLTYSGEAPAVKDEGAVLVRNIYDIEVRALPKDLPHEVIVDLLGIEHIGDGIVAKDLPLAPGVEIDLEDDFVVASAAAPAEEEIIEEETSQVSMEDIKTEAEEKREKAEEEKAAEEASE